MTEKARAILNDLATKTNPETTKRFIQYRLLSDGTDLPCRSWSRLNQFITFLAGTKDARGMRQWNNAGRKVKKGSHPFYILVPMLYPQKNHSKTSGNTDDRLRLTGFKAMPVFRVEDTEGEPLDYEHSL